MSANNLLVADAAAFCAKQRDIRSEKRDRQVASSRDGWKAGCGLFFETQLFFNFKDAQNLF
jgi:hypothetical protein